MLTKILQELQMLMKFFKETINDDRKFYKD